MPRLLLTLPLLSLGGCLLYGDNNDEPDDLPLCSTERRTFRISELDVPANADQAQALGWDFDGDETSDNQGGNIISAVDQALAVDLQIAVDEALQADLVQIGVVVDECPSPDYALVSLVRGVELDRASDPPMMLAEDVTVSAAVARAALPAIALGGDSQFPVGQLIHPSATEWIDARELVVRIDDISDEQLTGRLAAGVDGERAIEVVAIGLSAKIAEREAEFGPCDSQGCADDTLEAMYGVFDENEDFVVTVEEIRTNSLVQTLLRPDLDLDGDGVTESLSVGVGFRAEPVELFLTQ